MLIARIHEILPLIGPVCVSERRLIAAVTERQPVQQSLCYLDELPPPISSVRFPPLWDRVDLNKIPRANASRNTASQRWFEPTQNPWARLQAVRDSRRARHS